MPGDVQWHILFRFKVQRVDGDRGEVALSSLVVGGASRTETKLLTQLFF